ncbi:unnamed protein product [Prorocentrum cordatum]|uniref:Uncharacterized protein n=1 Tax=Prorocentrum cordatum TaxID=2364126 RepID=A0ABN9YCK8_9DINO|nr:unnamed protein product [Polarella glacialis]
MRHELLHGGMPRRRLWRRPTSKARPPGARGCARRGGKRSGRDFRGGELGWGRRGGPGGEAERAATAGRGGGGRARTGSWSSVGLLCARTADRLACLASLAWPADGQRTPGGSVEGERTQRQRGRGGQTERRKRTGLALVETRREWVRLVENRSMVRGALAKGREAPRKRRRRRRRRRRSRRKRRHNNSGARDAE